MKASELAKILGGKVIGEDVEVGKIAPIETASENDLVILLDMKKANLLSGRKFNCVVVPEPLPSVDARCTIVVGDIQSAFIKLLRAFSEEPTYSAGISDMAYVHPEAKLEDGVVVRPFAFIDRGARIGKNTVIHPFAYIGQNAVVGEDTVIHPFVFIGHSVRVGNRVILHAGVKLGADGFGFRRMGDEYVKIPQIGTVVIEDDVELGANTCVDRATIGETVIRKGTKIDNLVQVGHNVKIGRNVVIAGNSGVAGSSVVEDDVVIAGFVGIADHLKIGRGAVITAKTGVHKDLAPGKLYAGYYVTEHMKFLKAYSLMLKLPELVSRIKQLEQEVERLRRLVDERDGE